MAHGDAREGKWRGNWRLERVASTLHATSEHAVSSVTTADAHTSAASSRLNWRPRRFKWTRPFRRKTKSVFCACAVTFQRQSTSLDYANAPGKNTTIGKTDLFPSSVERVRRNTGLLRFVRSEDFLSSDWEKRLFWAQFKKASYHHMYPRTGTYPLCLTLLSLCTVVQYDVQRTAATSQVKTL